MVARYFAVVVAVLAIHSLALSQTKETIRVAEVEHRAGPSMQFPATGKLRQGEPVFVRNKVEGGRWLEILPPAGSRSFVPANAVKLTPDNRMAVVEGDDLPVRTGSTLSDKPLDVSRTKVKKGTLLTVFGERVEVGPTAWLPIQPVAEESRYIPIEAVLASTESVAASPIPGASASTSLVAEREPQWAQAIQAEKDGRWEEAERAYTLLCQKHMQAGGDFRFAQICAGRIEELRRSRRTSATVTRRDRSVDGPPVFQPASQARNLKPDIGSAPPPPLPGANSGALAPRNESSRSNPGWLRRSYVTIDGVRAYALETGRGTLLLYVTPAPGLDLEPYVERYVELYGNVKIRGDVRGADHMIVNRVIHLGR